MAIVVSELEARLLGNTRHAEQALSRFGKGTADLGRSMTTNLTLPILGVGAATTKMALDFDDTMTQIDALTSSSTQQVAQWSEQLLRLGPEIGKSPRELGKALYFVASAGFEGKRAFDVMEIAAKASAVGLGETQVVAQVLGAAVNAYGEENLNAAQATDILIQAVNEGTAEAPEFAASLGNVIGSAAQVGATFGDVTAAIAAMTKVGIGAAEATTSLNQIFTTLMSPTTEAKEALEGYGLSAAGLRQQIGEEGLLPVLGLLAEKFDGNAEATSAVFGNVRALRGVLALTGSDLAGTAELFDRVTTATGTLDTAFQLTSESAGFKFRQALASLETVGIQLGSDVLPVVVDVLQELARGAQAAARWWENLGEDTQNFLVKALAVTAAVGPLLIVFGKLIGLLGFALKGFLLLNTAIGWLGGPAGTAKATTAVGRLGLGIHGLLGPLGLATIALTALTTIGEDLHESLIPIEHDFNELASQVGKSRVAIDGEVNALAQSLGRSADSVREELSNLLGRGVEWDEAVAAVRTGTADLGIAADRGMLAYTDVIQSHMLAAKGIVVEEASAMSPELAAIIAGGAPDVGAGANTGITVPLDDAAKAARDAAVKAVGETIEGIRVLFESDTASAEAAVAYVESISAPFTDVAQIGALVSNLMLTEIPQTFVDGSTATSLKSLEWVNQQLAIFDTLQPGMLQRGTDGGSGLLEGMESYEQPLTDFATTLAGDLLTTMTLAEAMYSLGYTGLGDYFTGMEVVEQQNAHVAGAIASRAVNALTIDASGGGASIMHSWINGMKNAYAFRSWEVWGFGAAVRAALGGSLPTEGPLKGGVASGGESIIDSWLNGMNRARSRVGRTVAGVTSAVADGLSVALPGIGPMGAASPMAAVGAGGGGSGGVTVVLYADRYMGTADEARYYSDLIARQIRYQND